MTRIFYTVLFVVAGGILLAQDDDEKKEKKFCRDDIGKKEMALYEKGIDRKKYKKPERMEFLGKALDGLFLVVGQEEQKIRANPTARVTPLLKEVFGK